MKSSEAMNLLLFFGFFVVSVSGGPQGTTFFNFLLKYQIKIQLNPFM